MMSAAAIVPALIVAELIVNPSTAPPARVPFGIDSDAMTVPSMNPWLTWMPWMKKLP